jgi:two-component system response regulator AlgR
MRILIADDEPLARERLRRLLAELGDEHQVVAEAADGETALALCAREEPDVVLLDIEMPGLDGLEAAARLAELDPPPAVILVTAYPEFALDAFARRVADYLVKPVRRERLTAALDGVQIATRAQRQPPASQPAADTPGRRHLSAPYRGGVRTVPIEEVLYLRATQKYVSVHYPGGELLVEESLKALEDEFADRFMRVHRNTLVARDRVAGLEKAPDGGVLICLREHPERLPVSRRHLAEVRRRVRSGFAAD